MLNILDLLKFQGYPIEAAQKELAIIQSYSKDQFEDWRNKKAWEIAKFHFDHNSLYKKLVGNHFPDRWEDLPIVKKKDIQVDFSEKLTQGISKKNLHFGNTSGSSGIPLKYAKDKFCHSMTWALIVDRYQKIGFSQNDFQARFYGIPLDFPHYHKERLKDKLMNRYRFIIFDFSDENMESFVQKFKKEKFIYTYGYANSQLFLARYLQKKGVILKDICPSLKGTIVTSEQCSDENKMFLESQFGLPVYNEYGASELEFLAITDSKGIRRLSSETLITEVVDENYQLLNPEKGGNLIFTNIYNKAMPFIRYELGDLGAFKKDEHAIQDELTQLNGRINDTIVLPSGRKASGFCLYYISRHLNTKLGTLQEYQVRQTKRDTFEVDLVLSGELDQNTILTINEAFDQYVEKGLQIIIKKVDQINREKSGKLRHFLPLEEFHS
ncbi:phenylacetate--CoA ligase family protein [Algoriphagus lutimaris]|uniref:phenylacetate--CoA ligase family protein n=1 Tax=Algoriphagus lutimaris TaxID=613197 RepID=UPI00196B1B6B|nr:phenylacetate--CoA ligase family protein [Algoriphagus lutimaris]MBN3518698.1 phenylacetate--CoA ligase family protein [Algoriphagus lutimaris]